MKLERILIPMAKGDRSKRVLEIAFDMSHSYGSEITAFTVKDEIHDLTWSDKVSMVTNVYRYGKDQDVRVVPKIRTGRSVKEGIADEANSHGYDVVMIATTKRSPLSASLFGSIGDYVLKNSRIPVVAASVKTDSYPYKSILLPLSETINTRTAVSFALQLKKACGAKLYIADLRGYDTRRTHGFNRLLDNLDSIVEKYGEDIEIIRGGLSTSINAEIDVLNNRLSADAIVAGILSDQTGRVRMNWNVKAVIKESAVDTLLVKK